MLLEHGALSSKYGSQVALESAVLTLPPVGTSTKCGATLPFAVLFFQKLLDYRAVSCNLTDKH